MGVTEVVGVYDADGGLLGEVAYAWGKLRGTKHCSLCDITHSPWRRKPAWDAMTAGLPVPVRLVHLNELEEGLATVVARVGAPVVLARESDEWSVLVGADELDAMGGSVDRLGSLLRDRLTAARADAVRPRPWRRRSNSCPPWPAPRPRRPARRS